MATWPDTDGWTHNRRAARTGLDQIGRTEAGQSLTYKGNLDVVRLDRLCMSAIGGQWHGLRNWLQRRRSTISQYKYQCLRWHGAEQKEGRKITEGAG